MSEVDMGEVRGWIHAAGDIALRSFNQAIGQRKPDQSLVSLADMEIEHFLRQLIQQHYPHHGIIGEEQGSEHAEREFVWLLDPIDGTEGFLYGLPVWAISVGIMRHGLPYLGMIYLPLTGDCYWNDLHGHAYWNDQLIHVSEAASLEFQDWILVPSRSHLDYSITFPEKIRSMGSIAAHFCYVARGSAPAALIGRPQLWDMAAGMAILHTAGGVTVSLAQGQPLDTRPFLQQGRIDQTLIICPPNLINDLLRSITLRPTER